MSSEVKVEDKITELVSFQWRNRTWQSITHALEMHEMFLHLRRVYFPYDSETAHNYARNGGVFDVSRDTSFRTFYVHRQSGGLVRVFRAVDTRELRNGRVW